VSNMPIFFCIFLYFPSHFFEDILALFSEDENDHTAVGFIQTPEVIFLGKENTSTFRQNPYETLLAVTKDFLGRSTFSQSMLNGDDSGLSAISHI
jgi:hypothetical protein